MLSTLGDLTDVLALLTQRDSRISSALQRKGFAGPGFVLKDRLMFRSVRRVAWDAMRAAPGLAKVYDLGYRGTVGVRLKTVSVIRRRLSRVGVFPVYA